MNIFSVHVMASVLDEAAVTNKDLPLIDAFRCFTTNLSFSMNEFSVVFWLSDVTSFGALFLYI